MFEQSLYEPERVATPLQDGDLFYDYEIKNWDLSPRIYRILGISALANVLAIIVISQTSLLTMKGCDSPLVGRMCEVLDTVYVSTMLFGTDREWADKVYEKTELGDSEITFVDVSGETPPLSYPEGYFQIANPEEFAMQQQMLLDPAFNATSPGFPSGFPPPTTPPGTTLLDTTPVMPKQNPSVVEGELPTFGGSGNNGVASNPRSTRRRPRPGTTPVRPDEDDIADVTETPEGSPLPTPMSSDAVTALEINRKPLTDFADQVAVQVEAKEVDLNQPFMIVLNGVLTKDGKLDRKLSKFDVSKQKGDEKMINVAKAAIEAVGDSGFLTYLKSLDVEKVTLTLVQDDEKINAVISSTQASPERAKVIASGLNSYISVGKIAVKNPSDERTLLDGARVVDEGKNFVLNFTIPKPVAHEMITRKLQEAQAKKLKEGQPSGDLDTGTKNNTAIR
jgi:hypothetical protein